jgi:hypothetical protein
MTPPNEFLIRSVNEVFCDLNKLVDVQPALHVHTQVGDGTVVTIYLPGTTPAW